MIERAALPRFRAVTDEHHELVRVMVRRFDLKERVTANQRAAADQQLDKDRDRVGLGVRRDPRNDLAGQAVKGGPVRRRWPVSRMWWQRQRPRAGQDRLRLVERGDQLAGHSAVISVSAARAELSSQIDLFVA